MLKVKAWERGKKKSGLGIMEGADMQSDKLEKSTSSRFPCLGGEVVAWFLGGFFVFFSRKSEEYPQNVFQTLGELRDIRSFYSFPPTLFGSLPYSSQPCSSMLK